METILTVNQLTKSYGSLFAVKKLSFSIEKGHVYGILGPNGSGKSTTLGMVLNVVNPTQGSFQWFEGTISTHQALKKVGAIIERPNFYPYMTAVENLKLVSKIKGVSSETISEKLELVGLLDRKDSKFQSYSLGMKQRLAIASALLNNPEILILDEADRMLDMGFRSEMMKICDEATNRRQCFLFSATLEGDSVERFADTILNDPALLEAESSRKEQGKILQWVHLADSRNHKLDLLEAILKAEDMTKAIVFVKTREKLEELVGLLVARDIKTAWLRGEMPQDKRMAAMANFQSGRANILVATDVAARGLDIADLPPELKNNDMYKEVSANWKDALKQEVQLALNKNQKDILAHLNQTFEKILIEEALLFTKGRRIEAAEMLGLGRNTLTRKVKELKIEK